MDIEAALVDGIGKRMINAFRAIAGPTSPHPDGDTRPKRKKLGHPCSTNGAERA
jgi:hypothetical protein